MKMRMKFVVFLCILCFGIGTLSGCSQSVSQSGSTASGRCAVHFIDVGQGDAALIQIDGTNSLIDTGTIAHYKELSQYLEKQDVDELDNLIITHPDADHMGSAYKLIQDYPIENFYTSDAASDSQAYSKMIQALKEKQLEKRVVAAGDEIDFGEGSEGVLFGPIGEARDSNESSLVIRLDYGENSFLFTGDTTARMENKMNETYDIDVDVLKASHHGSDTANGIMFIRDASPVYSVISVGADNHYGHPDRNVLRRLEKYSSKGVLRTDEMGSITITSDGEELSVSMEDGVDAQRGADTKENEEQNVSDRDTIIGNTKTKIYHTEEEANLPAEKNRIVFDSIEEAEENGYRACQRCFEE